MPDTDTLTLRDAIKLSEILESGIGNRRVAWVFPDGSIKQGNAESISNYAGETFPGDRDVRDAYLRVRYHGDVTGAIHMWPIRELIAAQDNFLTLAGEEWPDVIRHHVDELPARS